MVQSGNMGGGATGHLHHRPTHHTRTIDGDGLKGMLDAHTQEFSRNYKKEMRRMNR
jgi:hypothetical protein